MFTYVNLVRQGPFIFIVYFYYFLFFIIIIIIVIVIMSISIKTTFFLVLAHLTGDQQWRGPVC